MKTTKFIGTIIFIVLVFQSHAQDTLIINNDYKWKIGFKIIPELSSNLNVSEHAFFVKNYGIQVVGKLKKVNFESGIYKITKVQDHSYTLINQGTFLLTSPIYYDFISFPLSLRFNSSNLYYAAGIYFDYLLNKREFINKELIFFHSESKQKINVGLLLFIGIEKQFNKKNNLFIEGRVSQNIFSMNDSPYSEISFRNFGTVFGYNHNF